MDYKQAGVDVGAGDELVSWLQSEKSKFRHGERLVAGIGGFAALFRAGFPQMKRPCLVAGTDGVGTKVKLAAQFKRFAEVGQDLVAMCVNDVVCTGAQPLFFLDYFATGRLKLPEAKEFLSGVRRACYDSGCDLIGGETAEMPGVYQEEDFDCAGFCVGVVDEDKALGASRVREGDALVAFSSNGFHSNGYSLLRRVFERDLEKWADRLLRPTHLYASLIQELLKTERVEIHALAHVTGGGMDNLLRVVPGGYGLELSPWSIPEEFQEVQRRAGLSWTEMLKTLNCGVGMVAFVKKDSQDLVNQKSRELGFPSFELGRVVKGAAEWRLNGELP